MAESAKDLTRPQKKTWTREVHKKWGAWWKLQQTRRLQARGNYYIRVCLHYYILGDETPQDAWRRVGSTIYVCVLTTVYYEAPQLPEKKKNIGSSLFLRLTGNLSPGEYSKRPLEEGGVNFINFQACEF
jgi:hypothetical protein